MAQGRKSSSRVREPVFDHCCRRPLPARFGLSDCIDMLTGCGASCATATISFDPADCDARTLDSLHVVQDWRARSMGHVVRGLALYRELYGLLISCACEVPCKVVVESWKDASSAHERGVGFWMNFHSTANATGQSTANYLASWNTNRIKCHY